MNRDDKSSAEERLTAALNRKITRTSDSFEKRFSAMREKLENGKDKTIAFPQARSNWMPTRRPLRIAAAVAASMALTIGLWQLNSNQRDISSYDYDILEGYVILQNEDLIDLNQSLQPTLELFDDELLEFLIAMSDESIF